MGDRASKVEIGDGRAASDAVVAGSGVAVSGEIATVAVADAAVGGVAGAAVVLLLRDVPAHGGITQVRTLAASVSIALGCSSVVGASIVEMGGGRAASDSVGVGGGVAVSGEIAAVTVASASVGGVAGAAVVLLSRDAPAHGGIT